MILGGAVPLSFQQTNSRLSQAFCEGWGHFTITNQPCLPCHGTSPRQINLISNVFMVITHQNDAKIRHLDALTGQISIHMLDELCSLYIYILKF